MEDYTNKAIVNYNNPPIVYMYDEKGIFTQTGVCSLDPLESKIKGKAVWLIPANATLVKPPASIEKHIRVFKMVFGHKLKISVELNIGCRVILGKRNHMK